MRLGPGTIRNDSRGNILYPAEGGYVPPILAENQASSLESKPRMLDVGWGILAKPLESLKNRST